MGEGERDGGGKKLKGGKEEGNGLVRNGNEARECMEEEKEE